MNNNAVMNQIMTQSVNNGLGADIRDLDKYPFVLIVDMIMSKLSGFQDQMGGMAKIAQAMNKIADDITKIKELMERFKGDKANPPTPEDIQTLKDDLDKLNTDLKASDALIDQLYAKSDPKRCQELHDGINQVRFTLDKIYQTPATPVPNPVPAGWTPPAHPTIEDLLNDGPAGFAQLQKAIQSWASCKDDSLNQLLNITDKGGTIVDDKGKTQQAPSVNSISTQLGAKISDQNQELQGFAAQIQQETQIAQNSTSNQSKMGDVWVQNQVRGG